MKFAKNWKLFFWASSLFGLYHQDHSSPDGFVSAGVEPRNLSIKLFQKILRDVDQNSPYVLSHRFTLPLLRIVATNSGRCLAFFIFVHEADGLLHKIREVSFLQGERVASGVELFLNDAQLGQFLEMLDAAVVVASNFSRYG